MTVTRKLTWLAALLAALVYRNKSIVLNSILIRSPLPDGYFAGGDFFTGCETLKEDSKTAEVTSLKYCEDISFWDLYGSVESGGNLVERRVLLSCDSGRKEWNTVMGPLHNPEPHGSLLWYAPGKDHGDSNVAKQNKPQKIKFEGYPSGHDFHPLSAEVYPSYGGNASHLYVINHARERTVIEQFLVSPENPAVAKHLRTISSPWFTAPNSLALTSPDSFYVTNDHLFTRRLPVIGHIVPVVESVLGLPLPWVAHVTLNPPHTSTDAIKSHAVAAKFIPFANGIAISHDGTKVAIVSTSTNHVLIYTRNPQTNDLTSLDASIEVPFCPDNIMYDDNDAIIVAGYPNFPDLVAVAGRKSDRSGSWVVSITPRKEKLTGEVEDEDGDAVVSVHTKVAHSTDYEVKTLLQSNGVGFPTSSTGLRDAKSGTVYVSGLYAEEGVMVCRA